MIAVPPRFSVIIPTNRVGGLDFTLASLSQQTFQDFEVIISDCIYAHRSDVLRKKLSIYPFPVRHVEPFQNPFPRQAYQRTVNTALAHASGDFAFFTCDYAFLHPRVLECHARIHAGLPRAVVTGLFRTVAHPSLHPEFPRKRYGVADIGNKTAQDDVWKDPSARTAFCRSWISRYVEDLSSGKLKPFLWSTFAQPCLPSDGIESLPILSPEWPTQGGLLAEGGPSFCCLKNDSIPLDAILDLNGFDEEFDGAHSNQDTEMASRLQDVGMQFYVEPQFPVSIARMHSHLTIRGAERPEESNGAIFDRKRSEKVSRANPEWNLRERS